jgi:YggT family protein
MEAFVGALVTVILIALANYRWIVIAGAIFSWLYAFGVVNPRNQVVSMIGNSLYQLTEPALRPLRRFVPNFGGLDITPLILLLIILFLELFIAGLFRSWV